jgi:hypothetical protein
MLLRAKLQLCLQLVGIICCGRPSQWWFACWLCRCSWGVHALPAHWAEVEW